MEYWNQIHAFILANEEVRQIFTIILTWVVAKVVTLLFLRLAPLKYHHYAVVVSDRVIEWIFNKLKIPKFEKVADPETGKTKIVNVAKKPEVKVEPEKVA